MIARINTHAQLSRAMFWIFPVMSPSARMVVPPRSCPQNETNQMDRFPSTYFAMRSASDQLSSVVRARRGPICPELNTVASFGREFYNGLTFSTHTMKNATPVSLFVGALLAVSFISTAFAAWDGSVDSWPASGDAVKISGSLESVMPNIEPSGLAWHSGRNQLLVVGDEGELAAMNVDGSNVSTWNVGGDLEDVAVADPSSSYVYLADENGKIVKFDLSSGTTVQSWSVTTWMPEVSCGSWGTCGMEALTYADGYFYAGYQYTGEIFVF